MDRWYRFPTPAAGRWADTMLRERNFDVVDHVVEIADQLGATPSAVAVAWLMGRPGVTSVILGPRTLEQLQDTVTALSLELPPELTERLDLVSLLRVTSPSPAYPPACAAEVLPSPRRNPRGLRSAIADCLSSTKEPISPEKRSRCTI